MCLFNTFETYKDKLKVYLNNNSVNIGSKGSELFTKFNNQLIPGKCNYFSAQHLFIFH